MDSLDPSLICARKLPANSGGSDRARRSVRTAAIPLAGLAMCLAMASAANAQSITSTFTNGYTFTGTGGTSTLEAIYVVGGDGTIGVSPENCWGGCGQYGIGQWLSPATGMANFEFKASNGGCPYAVGTFDTWMTAGVGTGWGVYISDINQSAVCSIGVSVRSKSNPSVVIATATINFNVWTGT